MARLISWFSRHWNARITSSREASQARDIERLKSLLDERDSQIRATEKNMQILIDRNEILTEQVRACELAREAETSYVKSIITTHGYAAGKAMEQT